MKKIFTGLFAVAVLGLGISQASAHSPAPHHPPHHHNGNSGFSFGIVIGDPAWNHHVRPVMRGCTVERASIKARNMGIRHQSIFKSPYTIKVVGVKRGHRAQVTFAREIGCPVVRY